MTPLSSEFPKASSGADFPSAWNSHKLCSKWARNFRSRSEDRPEVSIKDDILLLCF
jgi:hypothetical protein